MKDYFHTQNKVLSEVEHLGKRVGVNPDTSNPMNALKSLTKSINRLADAEEKVQEMGYSSLETALKALSQYKVSKSVIPVDFPEHFTKVPQLWCRGRISTRNTPGFSPLSLRTAMRRHRVIMSLLIEAWMITDEEGKDKLLREYLSTSPDEFEKKLYDFIYEIEGDTLEDQLIDEINRQIELDKFEEWGEINHGKRKT